MAATSSIARFTAPATSIAMPTSQRVTRSSQCALRACLGVAVPVAGQAGVQVDGVRHHGRAEHRGGQQHAFGTVEARQQAGSGSSPSGGGSTNRLVRNPIAMISSRPVMTRSNTRWPRRFCIASSSSDTDSGDDAADEQGQVEQQVQRDGTADHLGEIGCHGDQFGLQPVRDPGRGAGVVGDGLGQRAAADQAQFGRQVLHQAGHRVGKHDDPHQQEAELRAGADVGGDVAGVDIGDGGDERRAEQKPTRTQPRLGALDQPTHSSIREIE